MKKLTAGIFTVLIGLCAANSADAAIASKAWVEQDFATKTALNETNAEVAKKANADDVYTKKDADDKFETIANVTAGLEEQQGYTDAKVQALVDSLGSAGGEGGEGATGLQAAVAGNTSRIVTLETQVGGKSVATQISEALSAYTNSEDLAKDYLTKTDAANTYQAKALVTKTQNFTDEEKDSTTLYPSMATVGTLIAQSASSVQSQINAMNDQTNGILASAKGYTDGELAKEVAAREAADTELDGKISAEAQAREEADSAINTKIGTVATGKDVVTMISDAQTAAEAKVTALEDGQVKTNKEAIAAIDAELDTMATSETVTNLTTRVGTAEGEIDTLQGTVGDADSGLVKAATDNAAAAAAAAEQAASNAALIKANADAIALKANAADVYTKGEADTLLNGKQDNLSEDQMAAANSGITAEKVNAYETSVDVTTGISALTTGDTGTYVLTATKDTDGKVTYTWETIERAGSSNP